MKDANANRAQWQLATLLTAYGDGDDGGCLFRAKTDDVGWSILYFARAPKRKIDRTWD